MKCDDIFCGSLPSVLNFKMWDKNLKRHFWFQSYRVESREVVALK